MKTIILINCTDQPGIVHAVTGFIEKNQGNIIYLDQHVDEQTNIFFMRLESDFGTSPKPATILFKNNFEKNIAVPYQMKFQIFEDDIIPRMALFVSKYNHCLYDLLIRYKSKELKVEIPFICSNHNDLRSIAEQFDVPFYHIPVSKETKSAAEDQQLKLLEEHKVDFFVLARYMQIVSDKLISKYPNKIINIHHSFLPAFAGAKPYHAAFERGVKLIGATSHYVTEALDAGPIIEQDVITVSHTHTIKDLISKGRDLEKIVLSRAVNQHIKRKTMVCNNKTIIFA